MKFISAFVAGILFTLFVVYFVNIQIESKKTEEKIHQKNKIQYIEVIWNNENTELHTGMPKDSVKMLIGKPDEINLYTVRNITFEQWFYKIDDETFLPDLTINFNNGKLDGVRQD